MKKPASRTRAVRLAHGLAAVLTISPLAALAAERCPSLAVPQAMEQRYVDEAVRGADALNRYIELTEPTTGYDFEDIVAWLDTLRANHCPDPDPNRSVANAPDKKEAPAASMPAQSRTDRPT